MKLCLVLCTLFLGVSIMQEASHPNPNPQRLPYFNINANGSNANIGSRGINNNNVSAPANTARQLNMSASITVAPNNNANTVKKAT